jgi:hypothetical protein
MKTTNSLGIFMDHSTAHIIEFTTEPIETTIIQSDFTNVDRGVTMSKGEQTMHNTENHDQSAYYKKLGEVIKNYTDVVLFGPTDAKTELFHLLRADRGFDDIKFVIVQTDKMTANQQHAFVKHHFSGLY